MFVPHRPRIRVRPRSDAILAELRRLSGSGLRTHPFVAHALQVGVAHRQGNFSAFFRLYSGAPRMVRWALRVAACGVGRAVPCGLETG